MTPSETPKEIELGLKGFAFIEFLSLTAGHLYCHHEPLKLISTVKNNMRTAVSLKSVTMNLGLSFRLPSITAERYARLKICYSMTGNNVYTFFVYLFPFFVVLSQTMCRAHNQCDLSDECFSIPMISQCNKCQQVKENCKNKKLRSQSLSKVKMKTWNSRGDQSEPLEMKNRIMSK